MSTHLNTRPNGNLPILNSGEIWNRLHGERQDVCEALISDARPVNDTPVGLQEVEPSEESSRDIVWKRRELLHERLRQLDDALDRLLAGSYGHCCECGKAIGEKRLKADRAVSLCITCQNSHEVEHHFRTL
jgi:RNA polymerase-binding transcription factor DksA